MHDTLKISHHRYSGRLLPHEYTSYLPLAVMLVIVGLVLIGFSLSAISAADPPPQSGSIGLSGTVPASPPTAVAVIGTPKAGQHFTSSPITVSGTCPAGMLVEVFKNNIFAGSTACDSNGNFTISIDLLFGQNALTAQVYDALNQGGPMSAAITVYNDSQPPVGAYLSALNFAGAQMLLNTDAVYRGSFPGQMLNVPVTIIGGTPPFAINAEWGDSSNSIIARGDNSTFNAPHTYQRPGTYELTLQGSDSKHLVAFLSVAVIVNGQPAVASSANLTAAKVSTFLVLWPLYAIVATLVVSFWMGEQREKHIMVRAAGVAQLSGLGSSQRPQS